MPDELKQAVNATAAALGIDQSAFVREALVAHLRWHLAIDAAENATGQTLDELRDPATIARLLGEDT